MKTLTFADSKRPIITFEAEYVNISQDGADFVIQAGGEITFQDMPAFEELHHGNHPCLFTVTEGEAELLQGRYHVTFLTLEPTELVARISVGEG